MSILSGQNDSADAAIFSPDPAAPFTVPPPDFTWIVAHTRPRCEKKVEHVCRENRFFNYLPTRRKVHSYGARRREFDLPLFSGYLFCVVPRSRMSFLRQNQYVANVLEVYDQGELVDLLNQIRQALQAGAEAEVLPFIQKGERVRVLSGPLKGVEGIILDVKGQAQVIINVEMLQQAVGFPVDIACIGPIP